MWLSVKTFDTVATCRPTCKIVIWASGMLITYLLSMFLVLNIFIYLHSNNNDQ